MATNSLKRKEYIYVQICNPTFNYLIHALKRHVYILYNLSKLFKNKKKRSKLFFIISHTAEELLCYLLLPHTAEELFCYCVKIVLQ